MAEISAAERRKEYRVVHPIIAPLNSPISTLQKSDELWKIIVG